MRPLRRARLTILAVALGCACDDTSASKAPSDAPDLLPEPLTAPEHGIQIALTPFVVKPGEEKFLCQIIPDLFPNDVEIVRMEGSLPPRAHHVIMYRAKEGASSQLVETSCLEVLDVDENGTALFWTAERNGSVAFPPGIGLPVKARSALAFDLHYINASPRPVEGQIRFNLHYAKPGEVTTFAGVYSLVNISLMVQPHERKLETQSCSPPRDIHLLSGRLHMHESAKSSEMVLAGADGSRKVLAATKTWSDSPWQSYPFPGETVRPSDALEWSCDYENKTDEVLRFGPSATKAVMCNGGGFFYPAQPDELIRCFR